MHLLPQNHQSQQNISLRRWIYVIPVTIKFSGKSGVLVDRKADSAAKKPKNARFAWHLFYQREIYIFPSDQWNIYIYIYIYIYISRQLNLCQNGRKSGETHKHVRPIDMLICINSEFWDTSIGEFFNFDRHRTSDLQGAGLWSDFENLTVIMWKAYHLTGNYAHKHNLKSENSKLA